MPVFMMFILGFYTTAFSDEKQDLNYILSVDLLFRSNRESKWKYITKEITKDGRLESLERHPWDAIK